MDSQQLTEFVRARGLAVVATVDSQGGPQAALVGVAATDNAEIVFDTLRTSRKFANIEREGRAALVIGWQDEVTLQCEGRADVLAGADLERCLQAYFAQYPDGRDRAQSDNIAYIRVRPSWVRCSDYRPESFGTDEVEFAVD